MNLLSRRHFLVMGAASTALLATSSKFSACSLPFFAGKKEKILHLHNMHTGEFFKNPYWVKGKYIPESLVGLNRILRDHRTGEATEINHLLLDFLHKLQERMGVSKALDIVSGFRSATTNQMLRKKSKNVAAKSLHMTGSAVDIRFKKLFLKQAHRLICSFQAGGVGYYPKSGFIHMDVRPRQVHWVA